MLVPFFYMYFGDAAFKRGENGVKYIWKLKREVYNMQAIREIRRIDSSTITLRIPEEFREREVEIIVFPCAEKDTGDRTQEKLMRFDRLVENARKRNIRIDKDVDIDAVMNEMNNGLC